MEENKNIGQEVRNSAEYIAELEKIIYDDNELRKIVGHEIRNRLNVINGFSELIANVLRKTHLSEEDKSRTITYSDTIKKNVKQAECISTMLHLGSLNHKSLKESSEQFNLEEMIRKNILSLEEDFLKNNLGISYEYNHIQEDPIYIFANEGFMNAVVNTILFNLLKHAPAYSLSRLGLSVQDKQLELICENLIGKAREGYGEKTKVGFSLLDLAKRQLKGDLETEITKIDRKYQFKEFIGYKDAKELENHDIFSLRFYVPMKELTFHPPKKEH